MNIRAVAIMAILTGAVAQAVEISDSPERHVIICMQSGPYGAEEAQGKWLAAKMFAAIGVTIDWHRGFSGCPSRSILVRFTWDTPDTLKPGALAYSAPYEGTHIRVFADRIDRIAFQHDAVLRPHLLAHVLVHEITHVLEGVSRHSSSGIMMAHWGQKEYDRMGWRPLEFAREDVDLIYGGLAHRARLLMAHNTTPAAFPAW